MLIAPIAYRDQKYSAKHEPRQGFNMVIIEPFQGY